MITKYKAGGYNTGGDLILKIEVVRETASSVWVNGSRCAKETTYDNYFDTWDEAKTHLLEKAEVELENARRRLQTAQGDHGNIKGLTNPESK
jgi:hypothetical protein